jgi:hypothetical protein
MALGDTAGDTAGLEVEFWPPRGSWCDGTMTAPPRTTGTGTGPGPGPRAPVARPHTIVLLTISTTLHNSRDRATSQPASENRLGRTRGPAG